MTLTPPDRGIPFPNKENKKRCTKKKITKRKILDNSTRFLKICKKPRSLGTKGPQMKLYRIFSTIFNNLVQISNLFGLFSGKLKPTYNKPLFAG